MTTGDRVENYRRSGVWRKRLSRISAWALLACVIVLVLSGWGITQTGAIYNATFGLIDRRLADAIHRGTNFPLAFFFLAHVLLNIRLMIKSRRLYAARLADFVLIAIGLGALGLVVYMEYFRSGG